MGGVDVASGVSNSGSDGGITGAEESTTFTTLEAVPVFPAPSVAL